MLENRLWGFYSDQTQAQDQAANQRPVVWYSVEIVQELRSWNGHRLGSSFHLEDAKHTDSWSVVVRSFCDLLSVAQSIDNMARRTCVPSYFTSNDHNTFELGHHSLFFLSEAIRTLAFAGFHMPKGCRCSLYSWTSMKIILKFSKHCLLSLQSLAIFFKTFSKDVEENQRHLHGNEMKLLKLWTSDEAHHRLGRVIDHIEWLILSYCPDRDTFKRTPNVTLLFHLKLLIVTLRPLAEPAFCTVILPEKMARLRKKMMITPQQYMEWRTRHYYGTPGMDIMNQRVLYRFSFSDDEKRPERRTRSPEPVLVYNNKRSKF